ncbi:MAG: hypothetical protein QOH97_3332 [Actinoplanes sp.]|jgi:hypothetical protein|nr:hypothetical protein [Actinoplanes sp.]
MADVRAARELTEAGATRARRSEQAEQAQQAEQAGAGAKGSRQKSARPTDDPAPGAEPADSPRGAGENGPNGSLSESPAGAAVGGTTTPMAAAVAAASQGRATRVLRRANPVRVARSAGRSTSAWARRPAGRLIVPALIAVLLVGAAGTAGAYLVPKALEAGPSPSATPGFGLDAGAGGVPSFSAPTGVVSSAPTVPGATTPVPVVGGARPADALVGWAQQVGTRAGIPVVAVEAYGYAELVAAKRTPTCHLSWTTIAALGQVESAHGSANGAVLGADGSARPPIYGLPLDGKGGRQLIKDTDQGTIDRDTAYDRAVGPLQFIPSTWKENAVDADNNGLADPNDIDDAALTASAYLCGNGRDMSKADAWWDAILSYNAVRPYAQKVFDAANLYGQRSRV